MYILLIRKTALSIKEPIMELELFLQQSLVLIGLLSFIYVFRFLIKRAKKKLVVMTAIKNLWRTALGI